MPPSWRAGSGRLDALAAAVHAAVAHGPRGNRGVLDTQALPAQLRRIDDTLRPVVGATAEQRARLHRLVRALDL